MKSLKQLILILTGAVLAVSAANAQERYQLQFRGSAYSTNESGELSKSTFTHNTLIQDCIRDLGLTNNPKLLLVYNLNADLNGDIIEVIGNRTGQVFCQKLRLLFPVTLSNGDGSDVTQLVYVFPDSSSEEVGRGIVHKSISPNGKTRISGNLNFHLPADGTNSVRICNASFNTSRLVNITD
jgi:hypothetical protein